MDVSKYRTRFPPKEHEEAVRMLLEGLDKPVQRSGGGDLREQQHQVSGNHDKTITKLYEDNRLNSNKNKLNAKMHYNKKNNSNSMSKRHQEQPASNSSTSVDSGSLARFHPNDDDDDELEAEDQDQDQDNDQLGGRNAHHELDHELEFNSEESSSQDRIQVSPQIPRNRFQSSKQANRRLMEQRELATSAAAAAAKSKLQPIVMASKSTSTTSDSISTASAAGYLHQLDARSMDSSGVDGDLNGNYEAIPSRTIAIQCDLKLSSVKRDGYLVDSASSDLASMQASSISSTRYGFYKLSPETLEQRRKLARSISSRNIAHQNESSDEGGGGGGGGGHQVVSKPNWRNDASRGAETPARSSLSSSLSCSSLTANNRLSGRRDMHRDIEADEEFARELELARSRKFDGALILTAPSARKSTSSASEDGGNHLRDLDESDHNQRARNKLDQRFFRQHQQQQQQQDRLAPQSGARARDSLPRRPKTALSYVSTSRLKGRRSHRYGTGQDSDRSMSDADNDDDNDHDDDDHDDDARAYERRRVGSTALLDNRRMRDRAMSQQVLFTNSADLNNDSINRNQTRDAPAAAVNGNDFNRRVDNLSSNNSDSDLGATEESRVPCKEEFVLTTRRAKQVSALKRPRHYTSSTGQLARRSHTLTGGIGESLRANVHNDDDTDATYRDDTLLESGTTSRSPASSSKLLKSRQLVKPVRAPMATTTTSTTSRRFVVDSDEVDNVDDRHKLTRFNSMSLSRQQRPASADRSCNSINDQIRRTAATSANKQQQQQHQQRAQTLTGAVAGRSVHTDHTDHELDNEQQQHPPNQHQHQHQHQRQRYLARLAAPSVGRSATLSRKDRSFSQQTLLTGRNATGAAAARDDDATLLGAANKFRQQEDTETAAAAVPGQIGRSTSMKQVSSASLANNVAARLVSPPPPPASNRDVRQTSAGSSEQHRQRRFNSSGVDHQCDLSCCCDQTINGRRVSEVVATEELEDDDQYDCSSRKLARDEDENQQQRHVKGSQQRPVSGGRVKRSESDDSESPLTRTWANPRKSDTASSNGRRAIGDISSLEFESDRQIGDAIKSKQITGSTSARRTARSHSMRDVANSGTSSSGLFGARQMSQNAKNAPASASNQYRHMDPLISSTSSNGTGKTKARERFESIYHANQDDDLPQYQDSEETSEEIYSASSYEDEDGQMLQGKQRRQQQVPAHHHQPLDYDSQQRLNEIGLPEPGTQQQQQHTNNFNATSRRNHHHHQHNHQMMGPSSSSSSHLGLEPAFAPTTAPRYATTERRQRASNERDYDNLLHHQHHPQGPAITGRAMSQQSLSRPTMPLSRRLRRSGGGGTSGGSQSGAGSDVGGSSMSLVSRLRYENAHTRTPVVMYIPQAVPRAFSSEHLKTRATTLTRGASQLRRSTSRRQSPSSKTRDSSSDRNKKSLSRHGSDSESSSSMLRTLIKPRSSRLASSGGNTGGGAGGSGIGNRANGASGRRRFVNGTMKRDISEDEENMDGIGQLASEIDSYKFRRRYSVPKDAKINWFSKLKQRVTSSKS